MGYLCENTKISIVSLPKTLTQNLTFRAKAFRQEVSVVKRRISVLSFQVAKEPIHSKKRHRLDASCQQVAVSLLNSSSCSTLVKIKLVAT